MSIAFLHWYSMPAEKGFPGCYPRASYGVWLTVQGQPHKQNLPRCENPKVTNLDIGSLGLPGQGFFSETDESEEARQSQSCSDVLEDGFG